MGVVDCARPDQPLCVDGRVRTVNAGKIKYFGASSHINRSPVTSFSEFKYLLWVILCSGHDKGEMR